MTSTARFTVTRPSVHRVGPPELDEFASVLRGATGLHAVRRWIVTVHAVLGKPGYRHVTIADDSTRIIHYGPSRTHSTPRPIADAVVNVSDDTVPEALWRAAVNTMLDPWCEMCGGLGHTVVYCRCRNGCAVCDGFNPDRHPCPMCRPDECAAHVVISQ